MARYIKDFAYMRVLDIRSVLCDRLADKLFGRVESQAEIADRWCTSTASISNIETGKYQRLSLQMLTMICIRAGVKYKV